MQRPERKALPAAFVERARLGENVLAIEVNEGLDLAVDCLDAREAGPRIVLSGKRAACEFGRGFACGQAYE